MNNAAHTTPEPKRPEQPDPRQSPQRFPERHDPNPGGDGEEHARRPRREHGGDHGRRQRDGASSSRLSLKAKD